VERGRDCGAAGKVGKGEDSVVGRVERREGQAGGEREASGGRGQQL